MTTKPSLRHPWIGIGPTLQWPLVTLKKSKHEDGVWIGSLNLTIKGVKPKTQRASYLYAMSVN